MSLPADRLAVERAARFVGRHFLTVAGLSAISAVGRFVQTGWPSLSGAMAQIGLEILVEGARVALALAVLGGGNPLAGIDAIKRFFRMSHVDRESRVGETKKRFELHWRSYAWDFALYVGIALALNVIIDVVVARPAVVEFATNLGAENGGSVRLLLKNLTVIPFTIIFQICFVARLWNAEGTKAGSAFVG
jgi:hypothetical protein